MFVAFEAAPRVRQGREGVGSDVDFFAQGFGRDGGWCERNDLVSGCAPSVGDRFHRRRLAGAGRADTDGEQCSGADEMLG